MTSSLHGPTGELTFEVDQIDVTSALPYPSPTWRYTDRNGHEHYREADSYPTLTWVIDETYYDEDLGEEFSEGHWECSICGEQITPAYTVDTFRKFRPGRTQWYFNGQPISPERAEEIRRGWPEPRT